jgi:hypothetical protein
VLAEQVLTKERCCHEVAEQAAELAEQALTKERCHHKMVQLTAMLAEMALTAEQRCHEAATREKALANEADKQRRHETAVQEKALADDAKLQCCREPAARAVALGESVLAVEQSCQELADCPAVSAEMALGDKRCYQKEAERGGTLGESALAAERHCSLSAARAAESALATARVTVLADSLFPEPALAEDKRRHEETTKTQRHADDKCVMVPVLPPDPGNAAIRRIQVECALLAALLNAILAEIKRDDITHKAQAPPTTTSPHPAAMLSTPPRPMTYLGAVLSTMGGSTCAMSLALAPLAIPLPIVDRQLRMVRQRARPCCRTGRHHRPCVPSPPDKVLPSPPHPTLGRLPTPTKTLTTLARATSPCYSVVSSPPTFLTTSPTTSLLPFTFSCKVLLSLGGGTAHPFCVGNPPPHKCTQRKHQPRRACQCQAPNPQEHLLCGRCHRPHAPNQ